MAALPTECLLTAHKQEVRLENTTAGNHCGQDQGLQKKESWKQTHKWTNTERLTWCCNLVWLVLKKSTGGNLGPYVTALKDKRVRGGVWQETRWVWPRSERGMNASITGGRVLPQEWMFIKKKIKKVGFFSLWDHFSFFLNVPAHSFLSPSDAICHNIAHNRYAPAEDSSSTILRSWSQQNHQAKHSLSLHIAHCQEFAYSITEHTKKPG